MAYHLYQTEALVLVEQVSGEANKTYRFLAPDLGSVSASAQGIRLLKSKLRYQLNSYDLVRVVLVRGKEWWRLVGAERVNDYENIFSDELAKSSVARVFSLLACFVRGEGEHRDLFLDFKASLEFLNRHVEPSAEEPLLSGWELAIVLRSLYHLGYIKNNSRLDPLINFKDWTSPILLVADREKKYLTKIINEAIEASHI